MLTLRGYHQQSRHPDTAILVTVPLFAVYEAGLLIVTEGRVRNAAEVLVKSGLGLDGRIGTLVLNSVLLVLFLGAALRRGARREAAGVIPFMLLESAAYALVLAPAILVLRRLVALSMAQGLSTRTEEIILGVGAGLYEELVFRLALIAGGAVVLKRVLRMDPIWSVALPLLVSSLAFSAFHHVGNMGEPWDPRVFVFRFLAGLLLGSLFLARGLGIVCWTHAFYDVFLALR